jgi:putative flippase GtrA
MRTNKRNTGSPFKEYLRFGITGVLNTGTDFFVLNILIASFGPGVGSIGYAAMKATSFCAALVQSYFLNRHWVFSAATDGKMADAKEGGRFFAVSLVGFLINIASSSFVFAFLERSSAVDSRLAANAAAMVGTILVLLWNYAGYKFFVFRAPTRI